MMIRWVGWIGIAAICCTGMGCGKGGPRMQPVQGTVRLDGKPLEGATVSFMPKGPGSPGVGRTGRDGRYVLTTFATGDGVRPGAYAVLISKSTAAPGGKGGSADDLSPGTGGAEDWNKGFRSLIPRKYSEPGGSQLSAEVTADEKKDHDFELSSR